MSNTANISESIGWKQEVYLQCIHMEAELIDNLLSFFISQTKEIELQFHNQSHHIDLFDTTLYDPGPHFSILSYLTN